MYGQTMVLDPYGISGEVHIQKKNRRCDGETRNGVSSLRILIHKGQKTINAKEGRARLEVRKSKTRTRIIRTSQKLH